MRRAMVVAAALLLSVSCTRSPPAAEGGSEIPSKVKAALAEQQKKLESYRFEGVTEQAGEKATFDFAFRAPNRMRAELKSANRVFSFDGKRLFMWDASRTEMTEFDLETPDKAKRAEFLHRIFSPFVPEGWRAPLLAGALRGEEVREGDKALASVSSTVEDGGQRFEITWMFEQPAMSFAGKRMKGGGSIKVLAQHCAEGLKFCLPSKLEEQFPGGELATTELSAIRVNQPIPPEFFEIVPVEGMTVLKGTIQ